MSTAEGNTPSLPDGSRVHSADRFGILFENAPFSVQLLAAGGRTLRVNKAWEALWTTPGDVRFKQYVLAEYNILADPQLESKGIAPLLREAFAGKAVTFPPIAYDPAELGMAGSPRWVIGHAYPVRDDAGRVSEVILIHEDVTMRVHAENALRGSEMRLKQLANTIPQLAWMAEPDGSIHWYNDRWYEYTGESPETMKGWGWQRVHDPAILPRVMEAWTNSIATGTPLRMTFPLRGRDGRLRPFFTLVAPLKDSEGNVLQWFGTNTDVSTLQQAEDELRATEERLRIALEAGDIGIWDWDILQDKVEWSDRVYVLHGLAAGEFGGRAEDFAQRVHPDDRAAMWKRVQTAIAAGDGFSAEFRVVLPDGTPRWLSTWARLHRNAEGAAIRLVGATISIDAHKRAQAALEEADRRKDEFLAMLAHELRNPLAPITTAAHLLTLPALDEKRVRHASEIISRQARHMTELVDDLLDVSRVTRGLVHLKMETLDLDGVVAGAVEQARPLLEARRHALQTQIAEGPVIVRGDRTRLIQIVTNLLANAAKFTPEGGTIVLRVEADAAEARVHVEDNGIGIEADFLPHVFDLFTQGARSTERAQGGLGIGLALVKSIATLHEGRMEVRSGGLGMGSTFILILPLAG